MFLESAESLFLFHMGKVCLTKAVCVVATYSSETVGGQTVDIEIPFLDSASYATISGPLASSFM